jgi:hypothetical protein
MLISRRSLASVLLLLASGLAAGADSADDPRAARKAADRVMSETLRHHGVTWIGERVLVRVMPGELSAPVLERFGRLADRGVSTISGLLGPALDQRGAPDRKVEFILSRDAGPSHASFEHAHLFIDPRRIERGSAPYLHELVHALAAWSTGKSLWLQEGLAEHLAARAAAIEGYHFDPLANAPARLQPAHLDSRFGQEVLPLVGMNGVPADLPPAEAERYARVFRDRQTHAAPFYNLSWSFVAFLDAAIGMQTLHRIGSDPDTAGAIERETGRDAESWKTEWMASLRAMRASAESASP